nr:CoA-disulfide reductase [Succinivibrionaceae bacterium]
CAISLLGATYAAVGLSERAALAQGRDAVGISLHGMSNAAWFPGASALHAKVVMDRHDGTVLGAQAIGPSGAVKLIDTISAYIQMGGTVRDLALHDQAYAPPVGAARDLVNQAGSVGENYLDGMEDLASVADLGGRLAGAQLLDTRTREEVAAGAMEGFVNIPLDELRGRTKELDRSRPVVVACRSGVRAHLACCLLRAAGFGQVANLSGGYLTYVMAKRAAAR